ncbi:MAG: membrane protein insertion efficiency factor YidD [Nanoarchaeota archaeon]|nr:membrane protein insertion efficiency factor YidD [Nanoarchaeota archaeon]MBU1876439.1 membrane protein insertion efficiency factor YidD [Nanoarchaeota archaeon]
MIKNIHQKRISPKLSEKGTKCRFYPSCSNYGLISLKKYGFVKGWIKAFNRVWRCRPSNHNSCVDYP